MKHPQRISIIKNNIVKNKAFQKISALLFWLAVWQLGAWKVGKEVLLPAPLSVLKTLFGLCFQRAFWASALFTVGCIVAGFAFAALLGVVLAALAARFEVLRALFAPLLSVLRAAPVASFTILLLLWVRSRWLSVCISFIMVLPIVYANVLQGIGTVGQDMREMAAVFRLPAKKKLFYIYMPAVLPHFIAACEAGMGLAFKSGVAAEIIGLASGTIGEQLYTAKLYLATAELFAWTLVCVVLSIVLEKVMRFIIKKASARVNRGFLNGNTL